MNIYFDETNHSPKISKTKKEQIEYAGLKVELKNKSADVEMRMASIADVCLLEKLRIDNKIDEGIFILVSNADFVWNATKNKTIDKNFRFYNKNNLVRSISGQIRLPKKQWTNKYQNLYLDNKYEFKKRKIYYHDNKKLFYSLVKI